MDRFFTLKKAKQVIFLLLILLVPEQILFSQTNSLEKVGVWTSPFRPCWVLKESVESIASDNDLELYLSKKDGILKKINSKNSNLIWEIDLGSKISSRIFLEKKDLLVAVSSVSLNFGTGTNINRLSRETGLINLRLNLIKRDQMILLDFENQVLVFDKESNKISLFQKETNFSNWSQELLINTNILPKVSGDLIALVTVDNEIVLLSYKTGEIIFQKKIATEISQIIFKSSKKLFFGDVMGNVFLLDTVNFEFEKKLRTGGKITNINRISHGRLIISSMDNFVYLISGESGKLLWKKRLPGRITVPPLLNDLVAIVFPNGVAKGFVIDLKKGKIINRIDLPLEFYLVGNPLLQNETLFLPTSEGLYRYDLRYCPQGAK